MPGPRLDTDSRRRGIVLAALPLFASRGFAGTTTKEIAQAAGISEALMYKHFPSKKALYEEILRVGGVEMDPLILQLRALPSSTESLVHFVYLLTHRLITGRGCGALPWETRYRLLAHSYLEDGEFARLVFGLISHHALPVFLSCLKAAEKAGDLASSPVSPANRFWFSQQLALAIVLSQLPRTGLPFQTAKPELILQAVHHTLRGVGLSDAALKRFYKPRQLARLITSEDLSASVSSQPISFP